MARAAAAFVAPVAAALLVACVTSKRDDAAHAQKTVGPEPSARPDGPLAERTDAAALINAPMPDEISALSAVVEGACPRATAYAVGTSAAIVLGREAWLMGSDAPRSLYSMGPVDYDAFAGAMKTQDHIGAVGGTDEAHAWIQVRTMTGRGGDDSSVYLRSSSKWLGTPHGEMGYYAHVHVLPQPDGSLWVYGEHSLYLDIPDDDRSPNAVHDKYFAFGANGERLKVNLPGADMAFAQRMRSGELLSLGLSKNSELQLRRWSPTKKVDDVLVGGTRVTQLEDATLALGTSRAVVLPSKAAHVFYSYDGERLRPSGLGTRVHDVASWLLTSADDLMVATADGTLLIESKDGSVTEEKLPERGRLAAEPVTPWLMGVSGALYRRSGARWVKVALGDAPWAGESHPPSRLEWVKTIAGETWVSAVRTDVGFGLKKPGEVRVLYSSKARLAPLRCGAPFPSEIMAAFPPRATSACTTLVVVVASEKPGGAPAAYPKLGAALKDDSALGESLSFVSFGPEQRPLLGIAAPTPEIAAALVKKLAKVAPYAPEIVCGAPGERRRLQLNVKSGQFSVIP